MCRYVVQIDLKFGIQTINCGDDYNSAIEKYKEIKEFYSSVPCTMRFYNQNEVQFTKTPEKDFEKLYNNLIDSMLALGKYQVELSKTEDKLHEVRNDLYHDLEETDLSKLTEEEQIDYLMKMKSQLTKRRINEIENQKNYAFFDCFTTIYDALCQYNGIREQKEGVGIGRYKKTYYTEEMGTKKNRIKKLHNLKR